MKSHGVSFGSFGGRRTSGSSPAVGSAPGGGGFPGGGFGGGGAFSSPAFAKAADACASLRPTGGFGSRAGRGASSSALTAYRNCLANHGVSLPARSSTSASSVPPTTLNTESPVVRKALAACASLRPGSSTTTTAS
jgi:hypothetical protein